MFKLANKVKSLVLFASGKGSNAAAIIQYFANTELANVSLIVCNNAKAGVLEVAQKHNIPFLIIDKKTFSEQLLITQLQGYHPDLIVLAGFLWKIPDHLIQSFSGKIINIHPALLPRYGGKGMYGKYVHEAVAAAEEMESGITIHYVNEQYDEGATILQAHCKINAEDDAAAIAQKVARLEHAYLPKTIEYLLKEQ